MKNSLILVLLVQALLLHYAESFAQEKKPAQDTVMPSFANVKYGEHERELINFWMSESEQPLGVLLHIHGGGWMGGVKKETMEVDRLHPGYHFASIDYPLVNEGAEQPAMLNAALRAVQFLRYKAKEWNIDPERIVANGGSAGGCSSLLVALHDDVANPQSNDPVERFSSRIAGAVVGGAQTTLNPFVIKERIGEKTFKNPMTCKPFGAETAEELMKNWEKYKDLVLKCSPVTHVSKDDPPVFLGYSQERLFPAPSSPNGIHSPIFGEILLEKCKEKGVECYLQYKGGPEPEISSEQFYDRIMRRKSGQKSTVK